MKRIIIGCEKSGRVRDAFEEQGWDAWSCDVRPSSGKHIEDDLLLHLDDGWDAMIAHPPCTHLAVSGARYFSRKQVEQTEALEFVQTLLNAPIPKICLENPVSIISSRIRKPDQIVQPYMFGHPESKKTCLWLQNLPPLFATKLLSLPKCGHWNNQTPSHQNKLGPSRDRWKERSRTYEGIASAMASQWGKNSSPDQ